MLKKEIIKLNKISKYFGEKCVLNELDLSIYEKDFVSIMGKSGSGKTTLLNILGFFENISTGIYEFNGKQIKKNEIDSVRNKNIGFVFQSYNLIPGMTVYENVVLPIYYSKEDKKIKKEYEKKIDILLEQYKIAHIKDEYVDYISGGEKQRVCLARALACNANVIIADEPTGNLDSENSKIVLNEFKRMNEEAGKTIIIVTHDLDVLNYAKKKYELKEGKLF